MKEEKWEGRENGGGRNNVWKRGNLSEYEKVWAINNLVVTDSIAQYRV